MWRKYNPYSSDTDQNGDSPSLESLDDLFNDGTPNTNSNNSNSLNNSSTNPNQAIDEEDEKRRQEELTDIQKELEAKFDELFGSVDDES